MTRLRLPGLVVCALLSFGGGCTGCTGSEALNTWLMRMTTQPKVLAYQASEFFDDGRSLRTPPRGTVPQEYAEREPWELREGRLPGTGDGADGGPVTFLERAPVEFTVALLQRGRRQFDIHCAACHGVAGDGKSLVGTNMALRPPPSLHLHADLPDGQLHDIIKYGYGVMPAYGAQLDAMERWSIVGYVRALQFSQSRQLSDVPAAEQNRLLQERAP